MTLMEGSREEGLPAPLRVFEDPCCDDPDCFPTLMHLYMQCKILERNQSHQKQRAKLQSPTLSL